MLSSPARDQKRAGKMFCAGVTNIISIRTPNSINLVCNSKLGETKVLLSCIARVSVLAASLFLCIFLSAAAFKLVAL